MPSMEDGLEVELSKLSLMMNSSSVLESCLDNNNTETIFQRLMIADYGSWIFAMITEVTVHFSFEH